MRIDTLQDLYVFGVQDMNDGCHGSLAAMTEMRDISTHPDLRVLMDRALEAMGHSLRIFDEILARHGAATTSTGNKALTALGDEGRELAVDADYPDLDLRDLAIVSKVRNLAHYPEAGFRAFIAQAGALGHEADVAALRGIENAEAFRMMDAIEAELLGRDTLPRAA